MLFDQGCACASKCCCVNGEGLQSRATGTKATMSLWCFVCRAVTKWLLLSPVDAVPISGSLHVLMDRIQPFMCILV